MSDISIIGLGLMGAALARAIQHAGHDLTVWNRSPEKMKPFIDDGVNAATDVAGAITASPVILVNIDDYRVTHALLQADEVTPLLAGRTVVQLSTGTPREADETATWMHRHNIGYLDGAILAGPDDIGTDSSIILLSGPEEAHRQAENLLECLGGSVRYLGNNVRAASALDLAWLCESYGHFIAVAQAACICESEAVGMNQYASLFEEGSYTRRIANIIHSGNFKDCTATLQIWRGALQRIQEQGKDAGINTDFPDQVCDLLQRAEAAGYGEEHVMAMVKVLRGTGG